VFHIKKPMKRSHAAKATTKPPIKKRRKTKAEPEPQVEMPQEAVDSMWKIASETIVCKICSSQPRPPAVTCSRPGSQCLLCKSCADKYADGRTDSGLLCPVCKTPFFPLVRQPIIDGMLEKFPAECAHGCGTPGLLVSTVAAHEAECPNKMISCRYNKAGCQWIGTRDSEEGHHEHCSFRILNKCILLIRKETTAWKTQCAMQESKYANAVARMGPLKGLLDGVRSGSPSHFEQLRDGAWGVVLHVRTSEVNTAFRIVIEDLAVGDSRGCVITWMTDNSFTRAAEFDGVLIIGDAAGMPLALSKINTRFEVSKRTRVVQLLCEPGGSLKKTVDVTALTADLLVKKLVIFNQ
jgi:hypothetical protein